jgi:Cu+-exporting ATPase
VPQRHVDLALEGMTCATCAGRIEGALSAIPGVTASVNFATERASIDSDGDLDTEQLIASVTRVGYGARLLDPNELRSPEAPVSAALTARVIVGLALTIPIVAMSMITELQFPGYQWVVGLAATPVVTWVAWPFHRAAVSNLRHGATTMDTLVSLGVSVAYLWSVYALFFTMAGTVGMTMQMELFGFADHALYFESAAVVSSFVLLGRYIEARAKRTARQTLTALLTVAAKDAILLVNGREVAVPAGAVQVGDRVVVRAGAIVPVDGVVVEGQSAVDASSVTGESVPVDVSPGDHVTGGTINAGGRLVVEAMAIGAGTELARLTRMVEDAQAAKAPIQRLVDRISAVFVPLAIALSVLAGVGWWLATGEPSTALAITVSTLVIACPCALGLATPMALLVGTGRGARSGIIIRGTDVLESTRRIDTIVFDKTGTLTAGKPSVVDVFADGGEERDVIESAARIDSGTDHPIARAIATHAAFIGLEISAASEMEAIPGSGVRGRVEGTSVLVGSLEWLIAEGCSHSLNLVETVDAWRNEGHSVTAVAKDRRIVGALAISDPIRPTAEQAIRDLERAGMTTVLASGDSRVVAERVASVVGVSTVHAPMTPAAKRDLVAKLQGEGRVVAMVGDGINDAAALAQADCGIAIGQGTDVAIEASDIVIVAGDIRRVSDAIRLSRRTLTTIRGNLVWAFGYNALAIPIAMAGLVGPAVAGLAMALSSVFVVANSARLAAFRLRA